jgi:cell division protein ZapA
LINAANTVDDLMHSISSRSSTSDSTRIAVMACLHLADKLGRLDRNLKARTGEITALLDQIEQG